MPLLNYSQFKRRQDAINEFLDIIEKKKLILDLKYNEYLSLDHMTYIEPQMIYSKDKIVGQGFLNSKNQAILWLPDMDCDPSDDNCSNILYDFMNMVQELEQMNPDEWILDLRGNSGGLISYFCFAICQFVDTFKLSGINANGKENLYIVGDGQKLIMVHDKYKVIKALYPIHKKIKNPKISVIINKDTASAAEFITIILKQELQATIYGECSCGIITNVKSDYVLGFNIYMPLSELIYVGKEDSKIKPDHLTVPDLGLNIMNR